MRARAHRRRVRGASIALLLGLSLASVSSAWAGSPSPRAVLEPDGARPIQLGAVALTRSFQAEPTAESATLAEDTAGELVLAPAGDRSVRALWYDGGALVLAATRGALYRIDRAAAEPLREPSEIEIFVDADGTRAIGSSMAVLAGADGRLLRWQSGEVTYDRAPLLEGDELVAVAVDAGGTIYAVGRDKALYVHGSLRWKVYPYPTAMRPLGAAASPGGQLFIVGRDGLLVRFNDGAWDRPLVPGLSPEASRSAWIECWYSPTSETLWIRAGRDRLLEADFGRQRAAGQSDPAPVEPAEIEPEPSAEAEAESDAPELHVSGIVPVREHPIPLGAPDPSEPPATFTGIAGRAGADGDDVAVSAGGSVWLWEHERFVPIATNLGIVHDLALDEGGNAVWVATQTGLRKVPLVPIVEGESAFEPSEREVKLLERMRRRDAWRRQQSSKPRIFWMPTLRVDSGVHIPLKADPNVGFSLELGAGAMLAPIDQLQDRGPTLWLWPELAYRFETHPTRGGHLFDAGLGLGFGTHLVAGFYRPRLVVGGIDVGGSVFGYRHGLAVEALWGTVGLEFSHQYVDSNQGPLNDLRVGLSINLAPIIWGAILWATIPTNERKRQ